MKVYWLPFALSDLERIADYLSRESAQTAERVGLRIIDAVELLGDHPGLGRPGRVIGTRELVIVKTPYLYRRLLRP